MTRIKTTSHDTTLFDRASGHPRARVYVGGPKADGQLTDAILLPVSSAHRHSSSLYPTEVSLHFDQGNGTLVVVDLDHAIIAEAVRLMGFAISKRRGSYGK